MMDMILAAPTRWYTLAVIIFILDQSSKWLVGYAFSYGEIMAVMPHFNLTLVYNTGAAFSFLSNESGWQRWLLSGVSAVVSVGLVYWLYHLPKKQVLLPAALSLVLGGAVGNLMDRLLFGYVVDFIDWYYRDYHWPAFNLADAAICLGAILLLIDAFRKPAENCLGKTQEPENE